MQIDDSVQSLLEVNFFVKRSDIERRAILNTSRQTQSAAISFVKNGKTTRRAFKSI